MVNWKHLTNVGNMVENSQEAIQECIEIWKQKDQSKKGTRTCVRRLEV